MKDREDAGRRMLRVELVLSVAEQTPAVRNTLAFLQLASFPPLKQPPSRRCVYLGARVRLLTAGKGAVCVCLV